MSGSSADILAQCRPIEQCRHPDKMAKCSIEKSSFHIVSASSTDIPTSCRSQSSVNVWLITKALHFGSARFSLGCRRFLVRLLKQFPRQGEASVCWQGSRKSCLRAWLNTYSCRLVVIQSCSCLPLAPYMDCGTPPSPAIEIISRQRRSNSQGKPNSRGCHLKYLQGDFQADSQVWDF